jgi:hypothetical protein
MNQQFCVFASFRRDEKVVHAGLKSYETAGKDSLP